MATIFNLNMNNNNENFDLSVNDSVENFVVEFGEITYLTNKDFNKLDNRPSYNNQTMTGDTNIPKVPTAVSELNNDSDYQTGAEVEAALATKQDILTAGDNIDITNNVISATDTTYSAGNGLNLSSENAFSVDTTIVATQQGLSDEVTNRENADIALQAQIDGISASSDVVDIVGTYADLEDYDTSKLKDNDIIKVLQDSTQNNATTYYRWSTSSETFTLIGQEGPYYTKAAAEAQFVPQTRTVNGKALSSNITLNASDVSALSPNDVVQTTGSSTTQIMSQKAVTDQLAAKLNTSDYVVDPALADSTNPVQNKVLNNLLGNMPTDFFTANATVAGEGTDITLNKTMSAPIKLNTLEGDIFQQTYSGKNLYDLTLAPTLEHGITGSGTTNEFTFNGTATAEGYRILFNQVTLPAGTYTATTFCDSGAITGRAVFVVYKGNTWTLLTNFNAMSFYSDDIGKSMSASFTLTEETQVTFGNYYQPTSGVLPTYTNLKGRFQLEKSSTPTAYEPYVGGTASPNPSYPQDIQVVTGEQTINVHGKNLFNSYIATKVSWQSGDITVNSDGSISLSNNTGTNNYFQLNQTLSDLCPSLSVGDEVYLYLDTTAREIIYPGVIWNKGDKKTITQTMLDTNLVIYGGYGQTDTLKIMITKDQATTYEPYQSQDYKVNLVGKNLFDGEFRQGNYNNASDAGRIMSIHSPKLVSGEEYTVSCSDITGYRYAVLSSLTPLYPGGGGTLAYDSGWQTSDTFTFTANGDWYIAILVSKPNDGNLTPQDMVGLDWQVEENNQSTDYTPYYNYELAKIGTYRDLIYLSGGDWYVHKETKTRILNGIENWSLSNATTGYTRGVIDGVGFPTNSGYCDNFTPRTGSHGAYEYIWFQPGASGGLYIQLKTERLSENTITAFKTWLRNNPTTSISTLFTPTDTKITDATLISELNALQAAKSYLDTTHFLTTANGTNLPVILDLEAYTKSLNGILGYIGDN